MSTIRTCQKKRKRHNGKQDGNFLRKTKIKLSMRKELPRTGKSITKLLRLLLELRKFKPIWKKIESIGKHLKRCDSSTTFVLREVRNVF
jgi:hypothetical protein